MKPVPVMDLHESNGMPAFNPPMADACGVLECDGIFYARLKMQGMDAPLMIALHGVRSNLEAEQAFCTLIRLPMAECRPLRA